MTTRVAAACLALWAAWQLVPAAVIDQSAISAEAQSARPHVGDVLKKGDFHLITNPGLYGLGPEPPGNRYALVAGLLVRIDAKTRKILSILREQRDILD